MMEGIALPTKLNENHPGIMQNDPNICSIFAKLWNREITVLYGFGCPIDLPRLAWPSCQ
jgi:hypothetical protein